MLTWAKVVLYATLRHRGMSRAELMRKLGLHREPVDRLFRLDHNSRLDQLEAAFIALGVTPRLDIPFPARRSSCEEEPMMSSNLEYQGYWASVELRCRLPDLRRGRIVGIDDVISFHASARSAALKTAFQETVDDYVETRPARSAKSGSGASPAS